MGLPWKIVCTRRTKLRAAFEGLGGQGRQLVGPDVSGLSFCQMTFSREKLGECHSFTICLVSDRPFCGSPPPATASLLHLSIDFT